MLENSSKIATECKDLKTNLIENEIFGVFQIHDCRKLSIYWFYCGSLWFLFNSLDLFIELFTSHPSLSWLLCNSICTDLIFYRIPINFNICNFCNVLFVGICSLCFIGVFYIIGWLELVIVSRFHSV